MQILNKSADLLALHYNLINNKIILDSNRLIKNLMINRHI